MAKKKSKKAKINKELDGFNIHINEFGEIATTYDINKVNEFLNKNVDDKKLKDQNIEKEPFEKEEKDNDDELFLDDEI